MVAIIIKPQYVKLKPHHRKRKSVKDIITPYYYSEGLSVHLCSTGRIWQLDYP